MYNRSKFDLGHGRVDSVETEESPVGTDFKEEETVSIRDTDSILTFRNERVKMNHLTWEWSKQMKPLFG